MNGIEFIKMQGLGNDFAVIDAVDKTISLDSDKICAMADRRLGIGFDQLLLLQSSTHPDADFDYRVFNADGQEVEQCGNGARCMAKFIEHMGLGKGKRKWSLASLGGVFQVELLDSGLVKADMSAPDFTPESIPFVAANRASLYEAVFCGEKREFGVVSMGNPHAVMQVPDVASALVDTLGAAMNESKLFPQGVNVGFFQCVNDEEIILRVYERGVGQTLACGSGACAAVVIGRLWGLLQAKVVVKLAVGELLISWAGEGHVVEMIGPAEIVYQGRWF